MTHGVGALCDKWVQYYFAHLVFVGTILFESTLNGIGMPLADKQARA
jgi:hypothetical protein